MHILPGKTIGIIGGGQLGKMLAEAANRMGYYVITLDPASDAPAVSASHGHIVSGFSNEEGYETLISRCDVVTYEFENISASLVKRLNEEYCNIPQGELPLYLAQNRAREKAALTEAGLPVAPYVVLEDPEKELSNAIDTLGYPFVVKTQEGGYDGKGQVVVRSEADLPKVATLYNIPCVAEKFIPYDWECSIIGTRSINGEYRHFPIAENLHHNNILFKTVAGSEKVTAELEDALNEMLKSFMVTHNIVGTLAMEAFVVGDLIYVNELAPRPHNSGHFTIEGCATSQFEQHIRAICGLPLGETTLRQKTVMFNILGQNREFLFNYLPHLSSDAHLHLYGKKEFKNNRKMGHVTFTGSKGLTSFEKMLTDSFE
ncbi:5-(carboxyamino)imidazole ribonucleotide synthase [Ignatzschineria cameli]|uniref:N5-carboxyaminoimidazole ribonucleotide synthase n=1 Tax=Ignatzschineria cameli TaxID=2182793 RepID=A0ABX5L177_9GAMM|nr:5-(carboxyamino)imidazole ribonucleotide synthase [Ignatzschineria cameli]PWD90504.1 5-(carboxyamino)imidazole ribonucleotide synthase [Ignatzschineria cameli]PWD92388.1 5-(carboxyamino)imidazole ribonucleotide synthase [Ignatzschineria cameli]PWD93181.1 5-(carboxyamino)imidazole ribonucleotide synthase [Ignatzschineria cameli]